MLAEGDAPYCVILKRPEGFDFPELSAAVSGVLQIPPAEAASRLRRTWGILMKTADQGFARNFCRRLAAGGFDTVIVPAPELRPLPEVKAIKKASLSERGLSIAGAMGGEAEIPWGAFAPCLVCAGSFLIDDGQGSAVKETLQEGPGLSDIVKGVAIMAVTGIPSFGKLKPKEEKAAPRQRTVFYLDIISRVPAFRVCGDSFDYSYLGGRKEYSSLLNFRKLANDVLSFLPGAVRSRGAAALAVPVAPAPGAFGTGFRYSGMEDYEAERFWLWQLV